MAEELKKKRGRPKGSKNKPKSDTKSQAKEEVYDCLCGKCGSPYQSKDQNDLDNEGKCPTCKEKARVIAANVQKLIDQRRASRPLPPPRREPPTMPGTDYINAKYLI